MQITYGESPYPPCSGRVLNDGCVLKVEGPIKTATGFVFYSASVWCGHILLCHALSERIELARRDVLIQAAVFGIGEEVTP